MTDTGASGVLPISRGRSGALAGAAIELLDRKVLGPHMGTAMGADAKAELAELLTLAIDSQAKPGRGAAGWGVAAFLAMAIVVGGLVVTWDRIGDIEDRARDSEHYSQTLAHYLVIQAHQDYEDSSNMGQLLRRIAKSQGVEHGDIPAPVESHPPAMVQQRHTQHLLEQGH